MARVLESAVRGRQARQVAVALVLAAFSSLVAAAGASALNLTGEWVGYYQCETGSCAGQRFEGVTVLAQEAGSSIVTGHNGSETEKGTISGHTFTFATTGGEESFTTVTISDDGRQWHGTSHTSAISGTVFAERKLRTSAVSVSCYVPLAFSAVWECTGTAADASGSAEAAVPTGYVTLTSSAGGAFSGASTGRCLLNSSTGGTSAFCSFSFTPPAAGIPIGLMPIGVEYEGDGAFAPSAGGGARRAVAPTGSRFAEEARALLKEDCAGAYTKVCVGIVPEPAELADACLALSGCGAGPTGGGGGDGGTVNVEDSSLTAQADCPPTTDVPMTRCDFRAVIGTDGPIDPAVKDKLKYEYSYREFKTEVAAERLRAISSLEAVFAKAKSTRARMSELDGRPSV